METHAARSSSEGPTESPPGDPALIGVRPGYCGGRPHILGHRITVEDVAVWHDAMGRTPADIVADHPTITLAQVLAALAYYRDHRDQIDADIREGDLFVEELRAGQPSIFEKARRRNAKDSPPPPAIRAF